MADTLDADLIPHLRRADRLIVARLKDARAHAHRGDVVTATQRLVDLHHSLIGPDGGGVIGDARAAFYRDAYRHEPFDAELHDPARLHPSAEEAHAARTAPVGRVDAHRDLGVLIERARRGLVVATGNPTAIDTWHEQHATAIRAWARRTLSDSQIALTAATNYLRLLPEFRDEP